ncbi:MAG: hypothetical protein ACLQO7_12665 [Candidatus Bathyarchaeia archaeon]
MDDIVLSLKIVVATLLILTMLGGVGTIFALTYGPSNGYVQYKIAATGSSSFFQPTSGIINESVQPTGQTGFLNLILDISSLSANLTYSKVVNATSLLEIFPYLPAVTNQSLSYQVKGTSINANLINTGQTPVTFSNATYQATRFLVAFSAVNSSSDLSFSGNGSIVTMPSGLIDTVQLSLNQTGSINAALLSTNLSLKTPAGNINPIGASVLGAALSVAVVIAAPTIYKREKKKHEEQQCEAENKNNQESDAKKENEDKNKPSYWVD